MKAKSRVICHFTHAQLHPYPRIVLGAPMTCANRNFTHGRVRPHPSASQRRTVKSEIAEDVAEVWFISESMVICTTVFFSIFTYGCFSPNRRLPYIDNEGFRKLHNRIHIPFRVRRHRRGCQHESSSIEDENSHQRHPKDGGRSRSQRIQLGTPWHVSRGVKDLAPRLRDACNGIFPSDVNRVALGGGAKLRSCCRVINSRVCFCRKAYTIRI